MLVTIGDFLVTLGLVTSGDCLVIHVLVTLGDFLVGFLCGVSWDMTYLIFVFGYELVEDVP